LTSSKSLFKKFGFNDMWSNKGVCRSNTILQ